VRKCPYCDFNSHEAREPLQESRYVDALLRDLEQDLPRAWGRPVYSIFIGGGTPSLFSPEAIDRLLSGIRARLMLDQNIEITLEANPGTVDVKRFQGFRQAGINRLSMGVQSFDDALLKVLGRIHGRLEALRAAEAAREAGFENFNLDLMFGLPGQTLEQSLTDIRTAIQLHPPHLSAYQLTIEPNTAFHARPPVLPDDDQTWEMQTRWQAELSEAGYEQYEVSAYSRPGYTCRHNLNYWQFGDYLGIGAGAHAKITDAQGITRIWKVKHPTAYLDSAGTPQAIGGEQRLSREHTVTEFMMNAFRLTHGFPSRLFTERTGFPISHVVDSFTAAEKKGLIEWTPETLKPTDSGLRYLNNLIEIF